MNAEVRELIGLATAIVVVAGLVAVVARPDSQIASVLKAGGDAFSQAIRAATGR